MLKKVSREIRGLNLIFGGRYPHSYVSRNDGTHKTQVIDLLERPQLAEKNKILATPILIKNYQNHYDDAL